MIRVNLLPTKKPRAGAREAGKLWIPLFLLAFAVEAAVLVFVHFDRTGSLEEIQRRNMDRQLRIRAIKSEVSDHDAIKKQLEEIGAREEIISKLRSARTGPVYVMMELSKILSPGQLPTTDPDRINELMRNNPLQAPNARWDSRRLWITEFKEADRSVTLKGSARGHDDVAEFLRRLILSDYFTEEQLHKTTTEEGTEGGLQTVAFEIHCHVRY